MIKKIIVSFLSTMYLIIWGLNAYSVYEMTSVQIKFFYKNVFLASNITMYDINYVYVISSGIVIAIILLVSLVLGIHYLVTKNKISAIVFCVFNLLLAVAYLFVGGSAWIRYPKILNQALPYFMTMRYVIWWTGYNGRIIMQDVIFLFLPIVYALIPLGWELIKRKKAKSLQ